MHVCIILGIIEHLLWIHRWLRRLLTSRLCRVSTHYCWENLMSGAIYHMGVPREAYIGNVRLPMLFVV
jgi:hypothetical protein